MPAFTLLSLNCFGVPTPSTRRRLLALARELNKQRYSVVCLQEVQSHNYRLLLTGACTAYNGSAYEPFFHAPKGGLLTLAQEPFAAQRFVLYRAREVVSPPAMMDWALHKGVLCTRLSLASVPIVVLNTHLHANYNADWSRGNRFAEVEQQQLAQLAEIVRAQPPEALVIAAGDFNIPRGGWLYDEFLAASGMSDPLAGDPRPTHRMPKAIPTHYARPIDYALLRLPSTPGFSVQSDYHFEQQLAIGEGRRDYLSDHVGIALQVAWEASTAAPVADTPRPI